MLDECSHRPIETTENPMMTDDGVVDLFEVMLFLILVLVEIYNAGRHCEGWQLQISLTNSGNYRSKFAWMSVITLNFMDKPNDLLLHPAPYLLPLEVGYMMVLVD